MDLTAFQQAAQTVANNILEFPLLLEAVIGTVFLLPFIDSTFQTLTLSS